MFPIRDTTRNVIPAGTNKNRWLSAFAPPSFVVTPAGTGRSGEPGSPCGVASMARGPGSGAYWIHTSPGRPSPPFSSAYPEQRRGSRDTPETSRSVMRCHVRHAFCDALPFPSCISFLRRVPSSSVPSVPCRRPGGWDPLSRAFACGCGRVSAPARFARLIARARGQTPGAPLPPPPVRPGFAQAARRLRRPPPAGVAKCHAMSCSPCFLRCSAVPFLHIVPPPRSVLLRSVRPAAGSSRRAGPFIARICVRARAGVGAGAVRAPDCPRASRPQGAPLPSVPAGAFFAAPAALLRRKRKGGPGSRLSQPL